jgi:hypothetical protein
VHRLSSADDREALAQAREMTRGASGVAAFDLWDDEERVHGAVPRTKSPGDKKFDANLSSL